MLKKYKWILTGVLVVLIIFGLTFIIKKREVKPVMTINNTIGNSYHSIYLDFDYLPKYSLAKVASVDGRVLVNVKMKSSDEQILLYLAKTSKDLDQIPGVLMRRAPRSQYSEELVRMGNYRGLMFKTADKKERTVYFENGGQILEVTLTAGSNDPRFDVEFQTFLDGLKWKPEGFI